jgi:NAD(P)H-flavin reductase
MSVTSPTAEPRTLYTPEIAEVLATRKLTEKEMLFTVRLPGGRDLDHAPGQFVEVSVFGSGEAPISITSPPTQKGNFEICVRRAGLVTGDLHRLEPGATVGVRGPYGRGFDVREFEGKDILYVAGGLGLAPLRSLIKATLSPALRSKFGRITILYGAKNPGELLYTDELREWQERGDVTCLVTVDRPDEAWRGNAGVITKLFKKLPKVAPANTIVTVVGPPVMYKFVILEVLMLGISESQIRLSLERRMKCGVGKCGHCQMNGVYVCQKGPVFSYSEIKGLREAIH